MMTAGRRKYKTLHQPRTTRTTTTVVVALLCAVIAFISMMSSVANATVMVVDLGSEYLKFAAPRGLSMDICLNEQSHRKSDTYIGFRGDEERVFCTDAKNLAPRFPDNMIPAIGRLVGVDLGWETNVTRDWLLKDMHWTVPLREEANHTGWRVVIPGTQGGNGYRCEKLLGMLFGYAKAQAEREMETPIRDAVVVVPRFFTTTQRQAVVDSAALAGVRVVALVHPTTAAALQLGIQNRGFEEKKIFLIYDMGSTKTEAAVFAFEPPASSSISGKIKAGESLGTIRLLGAASDPFLGGRTVDSCIAGYLQEEFLTKEGATKTGGGGARRVLGGETLADRKSIVSLMRAANKAKEMLSANKQTPVTVEGIAPQRDFSTTLSRAQLESHCESLWRRAVQVRDEALQRAGVTIKDLDRFEVIGGGLRVPIILTKLSEGYAKGVVDRTLNADEAPALGAGYFGAALTGHFRLKSFKLIDVLDHDVTIRGHTAQSVAGLLQTKKKDGTVVDSKEGEKEDGLTTGRKLFPRNLQLPSRRRLEFPNATKRLLLTIPLLLNRSKSDGGVIRSAAAGGGEVEESVLMDDEAAAVSSTTVPLFMLVEHGKPFLDVHVSDLKEACDAVGLTGAAAATNTWTNVSSSITVDVRETESSIALVEKAELIVRYTIAVNHTVRVLNNASSKNTTNETSAEEVEGEASPTEDGNSSEEEEEDDSISDEPSTAPKSPEGGKKKKKTSSASSSPFRYVQEVRFVPKIITQPLRLVTFSHTVPRSMSKTDAIAGREVLRAWRMKDEHRHALGAAKNSLEAYLIWARGEGFVSNEKARKQLDVDVLQRTEAELERLQTWLDDEGDAASLETLTATLRSAKTLVREALGLPPSQEELAAQQQEREKSAASSGSSSSSSSSSTGGGSDTMPHASSSTDNDESAAGDEDESNEDDAFGDDGEDEL